MDARWLCCSDISCFPDCRSESRSQACDGGQYVNRVYTLDGQVYSYTGRSFTSQRIVFSLTGQDVDGQTTIIRRGRLGVAYSDEEFTSGDVIDRYQLAGNDTISVNAPTIGPSGLWQAFFNAYSQEETRTGDDVGAFPVGTAVVSANNAAVGIAVDLTAPSGIGSPPGILGGPCISDSYTNSVACPSGDGQRVTNAQYSDFSWSGPLSATYEGVSLYSRLGCDLTDISNQINRSSITLTRLERLITLLDGRTLSCGDVAGPRPPIDDGGPTDGIDPAPRNPNIIDPAVLRHFENDPVYQCKTCGG